jgi:hypothetical protein
VGPGFELGVVMFTTPHSAKVGEKPDGVVPPGFVNDRC